MNAWGTYALVTVLMCYPYCHAIVVGWVSKNSNNVGTRTVSAAIYNSASPPPPYTSVFRKFLLYLLTNAVSVQLGNIIGNNIYRADDKPQYRRGNSILLFFNILAIVLFIFTKGYYVLRNRQRSRVWQAMTDDVCCTMDSYLFVLLGGC